MTTTILNPIYDTHIRDDKATTNYDTDTWLYSGESDAAARVDRALMKFDFSEIPATAIVSSAILELYMTNEYAGTARDKQIYRFIRAWVYNQVTWNIWATGENWATAGGFGAADCEQTGIGTLNFSTGESAGWKAWTLTAAKVQEWISGVFANNGLFVKTDTESGDMHAFEALEHAGGNDPKLTLVYTVPTVETTTRILRTRRGINLLGRQGRRLVF